MNSRYFTCLACVAFAWLITGCFLPTTVNDKPRNFAGAHDKIISDMREQGLSKPTPFYLNEINSKAMRSFISSYWDATNPKWVKYPGGYVVSFLRDSIPHKIYYTRTGDHQFTIRQYSVENMPQEIRHMVESSFYDYSIFQVNELTTMNKTSYEIKIEVK